jgi:hypothetical protein
VTGVVIDALVSWGEHGERVGKPAADRRALALMTTQVTVTQLSKATVYATSINAKPAENAGTRQDNQSSKRARQDPDQRLGRNAEKPRDQFQRVRGSSP